ncbi:MAG: multiheme c-type cytochrome [Candidatus Brocadiales bacterium]
MYRRWTVIGGLIIIGCLIFSQAIWAAGKQKYKFMGNSGCKCHLSKGCFEGDIYKEKLHSHTFDERLKTDEEKKDPECLRCHASAYGMRIKGNKPYLEDVACEACHGPGEKYIEVKKNYKGRGKKAFNKLLKKDPMMARKVQFDAGMYTAGINGPYKNVKEQCLECHWEDKNAKNKCPKSDKVMDYKKAFKEDDHRDHDPIDDVLAKMSSSDKSKWKGYLEKDKILFSPLRKETKKYKKKKKK